MRGINSDEDYLAIHAGNIMPSYLERSNYNSIMRYQYAGHMSVVVMRCGSRGYDIIGMPNLMQYFLEVDGSNHS